MTISHQERDYIRELARRVVEIAASNKNAAIQQRWRDVNALRRPDRAPVWCRPVGAWDEMLPDDALVCTDPRLRSMETHFRRILIKHDIADDSPVAPWFGVSAKFDVTPSNIWGVDIAHAESGIEGGAWGYDPPLKTATDFDKLRLPTFIYNAAKTQTALDRVHDLLGDILEVRLTCDAPLGATLGTAAADLRGLTQIMLDMVDAPELMHRLMAHLRDSVLGAMAQVHATGLLTPNACDPMTCSDPLHPCSDPIGETVLNGAPGYENMWIMANSQEFEGVSPRMWRTFCLEYQRPIIEQFGMSAYGCCENLTHKIADVLSLKNLRIFVCSAWTDLAKVQEAVGRNYAIMWRQKASDVVFPDDVAVIQRDLENGTRQLQGFRYQIVLRELQTLAGHPRRLHDWTRIAKEMAHKYA